MNEDQFIATMNSLAAEIDKGVDELLAERDSLLAAVSRVREVAERWAAREIYPSGPYEQGMSDTLGNCWDQLVRALDGDRD